MDVACGRAGARGLLVRSGASLCRRPTSRNRCWRFGRGERRGACVRCRELRRHGSGERQDGDRAHSRRMGSDADPARLDHRQPRVADHRGSDCRHGRSYRRPRGGGRLRAARYSTRRPGDGVRRPGDAPTVSSTRGRFGCHSSRAGRWARAEWRADDRRRSFLVRRCRGVLAGGAARGGAGSGRLGGWDNARFPRVRASGHHDPERCRGLDAR